MTRNLSTIAIALAVAGGLRRTCRCGQALHDPRSGLRPRRGHEPVRRDGLRVPRLGLQADPRPLLHGHGARHAQRRRARCASCCSPRAAARRSPAPRRAAGRPLSPNKTYVVRGRAGGQVQLTNRSGRVLATVPAPLRATGPAAAHAQGARRQRARERDLPRRARVPRRHVRRDQRDQRRRRGRLRAGRRAARVALLVADRGAQGAGRRGAHLRAHDDARAATASTTTPTRARRSTAARPSRSRPRTRRPRRPPASSSPTRGAPVATYFFSTSGGRTEDVENTSLGDTPQPWLKSVVDEFDSVSPRHRWGPIRMSYASARARLGSLVRGRFKGIKVITRGRSPRIVAADVVGSRGRTRVTGATLRARVRPLRHVGLLHVDQDAQGAQAARRPATATAAPRRRWSRGRRRSPRSRAASSRPAAATRSRSSGASAAPGSSPARPRRRRGGRYRYGITAPGLYRVRFAGRRGPRRPHP